MTAADEYKTERKKQKLYLSRHNMSFNLQLVLKATQAMIYNGKT